MAPIVSVSAPNSKYVSFEAWIGIGNFNDIASEYNKVTEHLAALLALTSSLNPSMAFLGLETLKCAESRLV